jgi:hypothetical protein
MTTDELFTADPCAVCVLFNHLTFLLVPVVLGS